MMLYKASRHMFIHSWGVREGGIHVGAKHRAREVGESVDGQFRQSKHAQRQSKVGGPMSLARAVQRDEIGLGWQQ